MAWQLISLGNEPSLPMDTPFPFSSCWRNFPGCLLRQYFLFTRRWPKFFLRAASFIHSLLWENVRPPSLTNGETEAGGLYEKERPICHSLFGWASAQPALHYKVISYMVILLPRILKTTVCKSYHFRHSGLLPKHEVLSSDPHIKIQAQCCRAIILVLGFKSLKWIVLGSLLNKQGILK